MTPSSGASRAEFYDVLQQIQAREDIEDTTGALSYECEKKPMKSRNENPGSLDFMSELAKGRFAVTANVNKEGKMYSVKLFDKASTEGSDAATREFKNLKTLKHEKMVSLVDAFETDRFSLLQFNALPSTGEERSTLTLSLPTFLSALEDPLADLSKSNLPTLKQPRLLPAMELRSRAHITLTMLLLRSLRRLRPILNLMSGLLVSSSMSSCLDNFHS